MKQRTRAAATANLTARLTLGARGPSAAPDEPPADEELPGRTDPTRDHVFGNLYLTEKTGGADFTEDDDAR
ncbi:hypothetical protein OG558_23555 [Kribbella sp. NBC_01510]|uniref:hypothetical protein n=1 Tax=Kribbella sp. NBC_01510 TaxID=2903581 RepID=UPI0038663F4B